MQSIYWVITRKCTQACPHCYISAGADGETLDERDIERIVTNLPAEVEQLIIGGGETLAVKPVLYRMLDAAYARYGDATRYMIQTNGDLLDERTVEQLLEHHVGRIDVSSIDDFHGNRHTRGQLEQILNSKGLTYLEFPRQADDDGNVPAAAFSFWGATPDLWLGGVWPRAVDEESIPRFLRHLVGRSRVSR
jgi:hypothetical protein